MDALAWRTIACFLAASLCHVGCGGEGNDAVDLSTVAGHSSHASASPDPMLQLRPGSEGAMMEGRLEANEAEDDVAVAEDTTQDADESVATASPEAQSQTETMEFGGMLSEEEDSGGMVGAGSDTEVPSISFDPELTGVDTDGDGLDDGWEVALGRNDLLDPALADTDGDGTPDGEEDFDGDGLVLLVEQAAASVERLNRQAIPHPLRLDILVELDLMAGLQLPESVVALVEESFALAPTPSIDGFSGVGIHFFPDQTSMTPVTISGMGEARNIYLEENGAQFPLWPEALPREDVRRLKGQMLHLVVAIPRGGLEMGRGGEAVADDSRRRPERSGLYLYPDVAYEVFPQCGLSLDGIPDVTVEEAIAGTLVHELGHALQLGHDTAVNDGVNPYNVMALVGDCVDGAQVSLPSDRPRFLCACMQYRYHGQENVDPALGSSENSPGSRFSQEAADLMDFGQRLGVDTAVFAEVRGIEM